MAQIVTAAGVQISYDAKKTDLIKRHLSALIASFDRPDGGVMGVYRVSEPLQVLGAMIRIAGVDDEGIRQQLIFDTATGFQDRPATSIADFVEALGQQTQGHLSRQFQEYHVILPLNLEYARLGDNRAFTILGVSMQCESWGSVQKTYAIERLVEAIDEYLGGDSVGELCHWSGTPLIVRVHARTGQGAFQRAFDAYDLFCAILNFTHDSDRFQLTRPKPMATVYQAAGYGVFLPDGTLVESLVIEDNLAFQSHLVSTFDFQPVLQLIEVINREQPLRYSTRRFIDALRSFNSGLGTTDWSMAYLSLWQALEILTFGQRRDYKMNQVAERTLALVKGNEIAHDFLTLCADRRNDLVHRGQFSPNGQSEVILLKRVVRICLHRFFALRETYETEESLEEYYAHARLSTTKLRERKRVIDAILGPE